MGFCHAADLTIVAFVKCMDILLVEDMFLGFIGTCITLCTKSFVCYVFLLALSGFPLSCAGSTERSSILSASEVHSAWRERRNVEKMPRTS